MPHARGQIAFPKRQVLWPSCGPEAASNNSSCRTSCQLLWIRRKSHRAGLSKSSATTEAPSLSVPRASEEGRLLLSITLLATPPTPGIQHSHSVKPHRTAPVNPTGNDPRPFRMQQEPRSSLQRKTRHMTVYPTLYVVLGYTRHSASFSARHCSRPIRVPLHHGQGQTVPTIPVHRGPQLPGADSGVCRVFSPHLVHAPSPTDLWRVPHDLVYKTRSRVRRPVYVAKAPRDGYEYARCDFWW